MRWFILVYLFSAASLTAGEFEDTIRPLMDRYCLDCHDELTQKGGLDLELLYEERDLYTHHELTEAVIRHVGEDRDMPPEDKDQPSDAERTQLVSFLTERMENPDPAVIDNPGFLPSHRLSNRHYRNTIRDLVGTGMEIVDSFPQDDAVEGYDHVAAGLEFSSLHMERYLAAAHYIMDRVFVPEEATTTRFEIEDLTYAPTFGSAEWEKNAKLPADWPDAKMQDDFLRIYRSGGVTIPMKIEQSGYYEVKAHLRQHHVDGPVKGRLRCFVDGKEEGSITHLGSRARDWTELKTNFIVKRGSHDLRFAWEGMNTLAADPGPTDLNHLDFDWLEIRGPISLNPSQHEQIRKQLIQFRPSESLTKNEATRKTIAAFTSRAFRRPVTREEIDRLAAFARTDDPDYEMGLRRAFTAALASPEFLFHSERETTSSDSHRLDHFEIANRLSYFLWSTMPDAHLRKLAGEKKLHDPSVLATEVERMLSDPRARTFSEAFVPQWLQLGSLYLVNRNGKQFPKFIRNRQGIRKAMLGQAVSVFDEIARQDRSLLDLIDCDFTYVNKDTAEQYGIENITSRDLERVDLTEELAAQRGGLLTMPAVLMSISHPSDTNPSGRGRWILDALLGTPPPPPPPDVEPLPKPDQDTSTMTLRQRLAAHRDDVNCASCHEKIDPLGFALENYDQNGTWRSEEAGRPVETSTTLPDGKTLAGPADLKKYILEEKSELFVRNFAEEVLTYALRRGLQFSDTPTVKECVESLESSDYRFETLVTAIVTSYPFQYRRNPLDES